MTIQQATPRGRNKENNHQHSVYSDYQCTVYLFLKKKRKAHSIAVCKMNVGRRIPDVKPKML